MKKIAFTLAEIMIVLMVIAILTAILLPSTRNIMPNENVMKFKKGHQILSNVISELVNSDKYYLNGDLGIKADGTHMLNDADIYGTYFIQTFADVLSLNYFSAEVNRSHPGWGMTADRSCVGEGSSLRKYLNCFGAPVTKESFELAKSSAYRACLPHSTDEARQVITGDGIWYWDARPAVLFGQSIFVDGSYRLFHIHDENGFYTTYKIFCMDIDGVPENATVDNCVNECPFGYGIFVDGKILTSTRVDEWLEKSIQEKD